MSVTTLEAIVEDGQIKLLHPLRLPEKTRVYVVVPGLEAPAKIVIRSPRLAHPEQAAHFVKEIIREPHEASLRE
jgi:predicted DNA-binding antitoxin AbrB/MazE fold protein